MSPMTDTLIQSYRRLCTRADLETLRRNPLTAEYVQTFADLARNRGLLNARAWLLGRLILDLHPDDPNARFDPSADNHPSDLHPPHRTPLPLQQDIKAS